MYMTGCVVCSHGGSLQEVHNFHFISAIGRQPINFSFFPPPHNHQSKKAHVLESWVGRPSARRKTMTDDYSDAKGWKTERKNDEMAVSAKYTRSWLKCLNTDQQQWQSFIKRALQGYGFCFNLHIHIPTLTRSNVLGRCGVHRLLLLLLVSSPNIANPHRKPFSLVIPFTTTNIMYILSQNHYISEKRPLFTTDTINETPKALYTFYSTL